MSALTGVPANHFPWRTRTGILAYVRMVEGTRGLYGESWQRDNNVATAIMDVDWDERAQFLAAMLGSTLGLHEQYGGPPRFTTATVGGRTVTILDPRQRQPKLQRRVPENLPDNPNLYCVGCELIDAYGNPRQALDAAAAPGGASLEYQWAQAFSAGADAKTWLGIARQNAWIRYNRAVYQCTFRSVPWKIKDDEEIASPSLAEADRYVYTRRRYSAREQKVPGGGFKIVGTNTLLGETGFRVTGVVDYQSTWYEVPDFLVPWAAIEECAGHVNATNFKLRGRVCPPETVLFKGGEESLYYTARGDYVADLQYLLSYRKDTWNKFPNKEGEMKDVTHDGTAGGKTLYEAADLNRLFIPGDL